VILPAVIGVSCGWQITRDHHEQVAGAAGQGVIVKVPVIGFLGLQIDGHCAGFKPAMAIVGAFQELSECHKSLGKPAQLGCTGG
jgi:hypothetical protein